MPIVLRVMVVAISELSGHVVVGRVLKGAVERIRGIRDFFNKKNKVVSKEFV